MLFKMFAVFEIYEVKYLLIWPLKSLITQTCLPLRIVRIFYGFGLKTTHYGLIEKILRKSVIKRQKIILVHRTMFLFFIRELSFVNTRSFSLRSNLVISLCKWPSSYECIRKSLVVIHFVYLRSKFLETILHSFVVKTACYMMISNKFKQKLNFLKIIKCFLSFLVNKMNLHIVSGEGGGVGGINRGSPIESRLDLCRVDAF